MIYKNERRPGLLGSSGRMSSTFLYLASSLKINGGK